MDKNILIKYNGQLERLDKNQTIFEQGDTPTFFYYIIKGKIKLFTLSEDGKEFTHKMFSDGDSFGLPPLIIEEHYPSYAQTLSVVEIIKVPKADFFRMLEDNPKLYKDLLKGVCKIVYYKSIMSSEISMYAPEHRILALFKQLKTSKKPELIHLTRQQIANLTALRVETVIRHIKCMEEQGLLKIRNKKVYY